MSKEQNKEEKRCFFCHKRLVKNKGFVCKRCQLQGKDIGQKVVGGLMAAGTVALTVATAIGQANTTNNDNDDYEEDDDYE